MPIFTKDKFATIAEKRAVSRGKNLYSILNEAKLEQKSSTKIGVFLSHSHKDQNLIKEAIAFFKGINISVYVDWMDEGMPEKTSGETASKIKSKIILNDKFILLATNDAVMSKWCNWELGIGDTFNFSKDNLAILPLAENSGTWYGNEYLQIYPRIESVTQNGNEIYDNIFRLKYPNGTEKWLHEWIKE
ncbi:TIR domain-containing protein [Christiangramia sp. LLG6405-1]|uniref:TIR domain-containing protein n=1 Tax=Christiangramia sp. LLG6405-1 TaxID=3160832 RepID=UPI00386D2A79